MGLTTKEKRLLTAIGLASVFVVVEVIGGAIAHSLAIFSDAAHLLSDIAGFGIALIALIASKKPGNREFTFGLGRAEVFGAIISILSLWIITVWLLFEAYNRSVSWYLGEAEYIDGKLMFFVALFGVFVNIILAVVFYEEHENDSFHLHGHDHSHDHGHGHGHDHGHGHKHHIESEDCHDHSDHGCSGHSSKAKNGSYQQIDSGDHDHDSHDCSDHDHGHGHGHESDDHDHGHDHHGGCSHAEDDSHSGHDHDHDHGHDHGHSNSTESTSLVQNRKSVVSYGGSADIESGDGHEHGHDHAGCATTSTSSALAQRSTPKDANLEAAYLHVLTDLVQSVGVAIAGLVVWKYPHFQIIDPICTFLFSLMVLHSTVPLMKRLFSILMEGTPEHVDWEELEMKLFEIPNVVNVHDLHVWSLSSQTVAMSVHIQAHNPQEVLQRAHAVCRELDISHATIQVQDASHPSDCPSLSCNHRSGIKPNPFPCVKHSTSYGF